MFFAINTNNELIKATTNTSKESKYICPLCNTKVIIKKGKKNKPHFSHINSTNCEYSKYYKDQKKSNCHKQMLESIYNFFKSYNYVIDIKKEQFIIENSVCDMLIKLKNEVEFVVICQHKEIDKKHYKRITYDYNKKGYGVLWVFSDKIKNNLLSSCYITDNNEIYTITKSKQNKRQYFSSKDAIYLNQRIIKNNNQNSIVRVGIGKIQKKYKAIYTYDLNKENIIDSIKQKK